MLIHSAATSAGRDSYLDTQIDSLLDVRRDIHSVAEGEFRRPKYSRTVPSWFNRPSSALPGPIGRSRSRSRKRRKCWSRIGGRLGL